MSTSVAARFFGNIPPDNLGLFKKDNQPNTEEIVKFLHLKRDEIAAATKIPIASVRHDRVPEALRDRAMEWAVAINQVYSFFQDQHRTMLWFQTPNPMLGGIKPKDMIIRGRFQKLLKFIQTSLEENGNRTDGTQA